MKLIKTDEVELLQGGVALLNTYQRRSGARGRFVAIYLGLRRMGERIAPLGSRTFTAISEIEASLDEMWTKSHRPMPVNILTAPFGGSSSVNAGYSTATGITAPGRS